MRPGERIVIADVSSEFGVSLGAVREALSGLEGEGLVLALAKRGFQVLGVSVNELYDLTRARIEVESACLRLSIAEGDVEWESLLVAARYKLEATPRRSGGFADELSQDWSEAHARFHAALVAGCRNKTLLAIRQSLFDRAERYRRLSVPVDRKLRDVDAEHRALADAALLRDTDKASILMQEHLTRTAQVVGQAALPDQQERGTA